MTHHLDLSASTEAIREFSIESLFEFGAGTINNNLAWTAEGGYQFDASSPGLSPGDIVFLQYRGVNYDLSRTFRDLLATDPDHEVPFFNNPYFSTSSTPITADVFATYSVPNGPGETGGSYTVFEGLSSVQLTEPVIPDVSPDVYDYDTAEEARDALDTAFQEVVDDSYAQVATQMSTLITDDIVFATWTGAGNEAAPQRAGTLTIDPAAGLTYADLFPSTADSVPGALENIDISGILDGTQSFELTLTGGDDELWESNFDLDVADWRINAGDGNDYIRMQTASTIFGGDGDDTLRGGAMADSLDGGAGADELNAGDGDNEVSGGLGADRIGAGSGNDLLRGGDGDDSVFGGGGNDTLHGDAGADFMDGGLGDDIYFVDDITDRVVDRAGEGNDTLYTSIDFTLADFQHEFETVAVTGTQGLFLVGNADGQHFIGGAGDDTFIANAGNDTITGGQGDDVIFGGDGDDLVVLSGQSADARVLPGGDQGLITVQTVDGTDQINFDVEQIAFDDTVLSYADLTALTLGTQASAGDDRIGGTSQADSIAAGTGNDLVTAIGGADTVMGEGGFDTLEGGAGDDHLDGGAQADSLFGGDGNDTLLGQDGFDQLYGGAGDDSLEAGAAPDRAYGGDGDDVIRGGSNVGLTVDGLFGEAGNDTIFGEAGYDLLDGGDGDDLLSGGNQADNLYGQAGEDTLLGGQGLDRLFGGDGDDLLRGGEGPDGHFGEQGNDTLEGGTGDDRFFGGQGNDLVRGEDGVDTLYGGAGFDTLIGGAGDDLLQGNFNADTFVFADGFGNDTIADFDATNALERIDLSAVTSVTDFGTLSAGGIAQVGSDVVITIGADSLTLSNVAAGDLDAGDFIF